MSISIRLEYRQGSVFNIIVIPHQAFSGGLCVGAGQVADHFLEDVAVVSLKGGSVNLGELIFM